MGGRLMVEYLRNRKIRKICHKLGKICESGPKFEGFLDLKNSRTPFRGVIHP